MTEFLEKLQKIIREEFPDTEDSQYDVSQKLLDKYPWKSRHIFLVHKTWRQQGKWQTASVCFNDREQLGSPAIKFRIRSLSIIDGECNDPVSKKDVRQFIRDT